MHLLLADTLHHVNHFSMFLQTKNVVYSGLSPKFLQLCTKIENLTTEDGPLFSKHSEEFLNLSY